MSVCIWSVICRVRSVRLATALMMSDGAIPPSKGRLLIFVGFGQPGQWGNAKELMSIASV